MKKKEMEKVIINSLIYWKEYNGTGDDYRRTHDRACILTNGNLHAYPLFSCWLPLRYCLNYFEKEGFGKFKNWSRWKTYEYDFLRPKQLILKDSREFLDDMINNIEKYLDFENEVAIKLSHLFEIGCERANVIIVPDRTWIHKRGGEPYYEYMPHFMHDLFDMVDNEFLRKWILRESLQDFFKDGNITKENLKDLAGTGDPCHHHPAHIDLELLLDNYISILEERKKLLASPKST